MRLSWEIFAATTKKFSVRLRRHPYFGDFPSKFLEIKIVAADAEVVNDVGASNSLAVLECTSPLALLKWLGK